MVVVDMDAPVSPGSLLMVVMVPLLAGMLLVGLLFSADLVFLPFVVALVRAAGAAWWVT